MSEPIELSIYGYTNYRLYLADYYQLRKKSRRGYSYRQFAQQAGFTSPNYLKLVIEGQRSLSGQSIEQFITGLGLSQPMAAYFRCLVAWNQAADDTEKTRLFQELKRLTPASRRYELEADAMEYIQHWIYPVLREMVLNGEFRDDPYWIERRLSGRIDIREITSALSFLKTRGFILKDESGAYKVKDDVVISSDEVRSLAVRTYHRRALEQAITMLDDLPLTQREYGALIIQLPEDSIAELKQKLKDFRKQLHQWALDKGKQGSGGVVIQCNFQMYPQSKRISNP
jgi:uncharacterized protein (TIGR02147 family)